MAFVPPHRRRAGGEACTADRLSGHFWQQRYLWRLVSGSDALRLPLSLIEAVAAPSAGVRICMRSERKVARAFANVFWTRRHGSAQLQLPRSLSQPRYSPLNPAEK